MNDQQKTFFTNEIITFPDESSCEGAEKGGKETDCIAIEGGTVEAEDKVRRVGGGTDDFQSLY